jgi:hypothetical protein
MKMTSNLVFVGMDGDNASVYLDNKITSQKYEFAAKKRPDPIYFF